MFLHCPFFWYAANYSPTFDDCSYWQLKFSQHNLRSLGAILFCQSKAIIDKYLLSEVDWVIDIWPIPINWFCHWFVNWFSNHRLTSIGQSRASVLEKWTKLNSPGKRAEVCTIKLQWAYVSLTLLILSIYYIKVSGIASGNKLIKMIR